MFLQALVEVVSEEEVDSAETEALVEAVSEEDSAEIEEAMMAVSDINTSLVLTGTGDVLEPEDGLIGIGSGGSFALAAARALIDRDDMGAEDIARRAMQIAAGICVYTNENLTVESLKPEDSV